MPDAPFIDPWLPAPDDDGFTPNVRDAIAIRVFRLNGTEQDGDTAPDDVEPTELPNVRCVEVEQREGPYPRTAVLRYVFDGRDDEAPQFIEQALSTSITTADFPHLVEIGDRLGVLATRPDGGEEWLFSGCPLTWSFTMARNRRSVLMVAVGDEKRCWDTPVTGAIWRNSDGPEDAGSDVQTDLVWQFNPRGVPNASPGTADSGDDPYTYPVVMDPHVTGEDSDGDDYPRMFDLPMAVSSLLNTQNADQEWVTHQKTSDLEDLLVAREPIDGTAFNPNDSSTYDAKDIQASDMPLSSKDWPTCVHTLTANSGFGMSWDLSSNGSGNPQTALRLFLKQAADPKPLLLQPPGDVLDVSLTNLGEAQVGRDLSSVANEWTVIGDQKSYELSVVLAPGFPSAQADSSTTASLVAFNTSDTTYDTTNHDAYRLYIFDETGEGHYPNNAPATAGPTTKVGGMATSLDSVLGSPDDSTDPPTRAYVYRRRAPIGELFARDDNGRPLRAKLSISTNYTGAYPAVWDGTGTWQPIQGSFELLKDRIGVYLTMKNPNDWNIGTTSASGMPFGSGVVRAVECLGNPSTATPKYTPAFFLRLTCVIQGDQAIKATAERQDTSPIADTITREVDARDRIRYEVIAAKSEHNSTDTPSIVRDDSDLAMSEAVAYRTASDSGMMEGEIQIPRFTMSYDIGDRISGIYGRGLSFRTDNGGAGFAPVLPMVGSRRWILEGQQRTVLQLSDSGMDRKRYGLKKRESGVDRFIAQMRKPASNSKS